MGWLSDLFSGGNGSTDGRERERDPLVRVAQLRQGVVSAAAALEESHPEAARRANEVVDGLVGQLPGTDPDVYDEHDPGHERPGEAGLEARVSGGERERELAREAVECLDGLHFALLEVAVKGASPREAGLEEALEEAAGLAGRLEEDSPVEGAAAGE